MGDEADAIWDSQVGDMADDYDREEEEQRECERQEARKVMTPVKREIQTLRQRVRRNDKTISILLDTVERLKKELKACKDSR